MYTKADRQRVTNKALDGLQVNGHVNSMGGDGTIGRQVSSVMLLVSM